MLHLQLQLQKQASYFFLFQKRKIVTCFFCLFFLGVLSNGAAQTNFFVSGNITNTGTNSYSNVYVGSNSSGNTYNILSSTSVVNISTNLLVGFGSGIAANSNSLVISNGGIVSDLNGFVGQYSANNNSALVTGSGSLWSNSGTLSMGDAFSTNNSLTVSNGAHLVSSNAQLDFDATAVGSSILITGSGSQWSNTGNVDIGVSGVGSSVTISNRGKLLSGSTTIGDSNGASGSVTVTGSTSLLSNSGSMIIGNNGTGTVTLSGGATLAASGITMGSNAGSVATLNIGDNNEAGNIVGNIQFGAGSNTVTFNQTDNPYFTNQMSGGTNVTINYFGFGNVTNAASNSYGGQTLMVSGGSLTLANSNALGRPTNSLEVGAMTLNLGGLTVQQGAVTLTASILTNGTLIGDSFNSSSGNAQIGVALAGTNAAFTNELLAQTVFYQTNTYSGPTVMNNGSLTLSNNATLGAAGNNLAMTSDIGSNVLDLGGSTQTLGVITLAGSANTNFITNGTIIITNGLTASGSNSILVNLNGAGKVTNTGGVMALLQSNNYTGGTVITGGELISSNAYGLGAVTNTTAISGGGILDLGGTNQTQGSITLNGGTIQNGMLTNTPIIGAGGTNLISASIAGTNSVANSGGTNTLTASNSYSGGTVITGGTIVSSNNSALGANNGITYVSNGTLSIASSITNTQAGVTLTNATVSGGTLNVTGSISANAGTNLISSVISGGGNFLNNGGTNTSTASNSYTGGTTISGGELISSNAYGLGATNGTVAISGSGILDLGGTNQAQASVTLNGGTVQSGTLTNTTIIGDSGSNNVTANLAGSGSVTNTAGTNTLSGNNAYTGGTFVNGGTLAASGSGTFGVSTNVLSISNTGTVDLGTTTQSVGALNMNGGNLTNGNLNATTFGLTSGTSLISGTMSNTSGYTISGGSNTIQGTNNNGANNYAISGGSNTISAILNGSGGLTLAGGTTLLSGGNTYSGNTIITGGTLISSNNNALGNNANRIFITNGTLNIFSSITNTQVAVILTNGIISGPGVLNITGGINAVGGSNLISSSLIGTGGMTNSVGTNTLSASNNYTGGTTITGGTLQVGNRYALGAITNATAISSNGILDLQGLTQIQQGLVNLNNGGVTNGALTNTAVNATAGTNTVAVSLTGTSSFTNSGGTSTLTGVNNSYSNGTVILSGNLIVATNSSLGNTSGLTYINGGGTLNLSGGTQAQYLITMTNGTVTNGTLNNTGIQMQSGSNAVATTLTGFSYLSSLGGTNTFSGINNTYNNGTYAVGGVLIIGSNSTLGTNTGTTYIGGGGTLNLSGGNQVQSLVYITNGIATNGSFSNTVVQGFTGTNTIATALVGTSSLLAASLASTNNNGSSITYLTSSNNSYTGGTKISGATLIVTNGGKLGAATGTTTLTNHSTLNLGNSTQVQSLLTMGGCLVSNGNISNTEVLFTAGTNTVSASIVGTSSVVSIGGTNTLAGTNNTYTGGTYITNSEIIVTANSSLGASSNTLSMSNATLDLSGGTNIQGNITINKVTMTNGTLKANSLNISGGTNTITANLQNSATGPLSITNTAGSTTLLGNNTYSGNLVLNGGNVIAGSQTGLGNSSALLNGSSVLTISNANTTANSLSWMSTNAALNLSSENSFLQVNGLYMANTENGVNQLQVNVVDNDEHTAIAYLNGTNVVAASFNIAGTTPGGDSIVVGGTTNIGGITFDTVNYKISSNGSFVVLGTEIIANNFTTANLEYGADSTLIIASHATLNVTTKYTSKNSATLNYQFTGNSSDPARITVGSNMFLAGTFIGNFVGTAPVVGTRYAVATAGQITGTFTNDYTTEVDMNGVKNPLLRGRIICVGDLELYDLIAPTSYTEMAQNQNQHNVAAALDSFIPTARGTDNYTVSVALDSLSASEYSTAFSAISPALYTSMSTIAISTAVNQYNEMVQRLAYIRVAGVGFSSMGFADSPIMDDNKNPCSSQKDILIPSVDNHWGFFTDGNGVFANVNIANQLPGYSAESGGVIFGSDYKWNDTFSTGLYVGYEGMQTKQSGGNFISDNGSRFGAFGTYQHGGLFANAIAGGASHSYQVNRGIVFTGFNRTASSAPTAGELDALLATGYDVKRGAFTFGPITSLQYTYFGLQPFTETGAQSLDLSVGNANATSLNYILGSHCLYDWKANKNLSVTPQLSLGWQHEFLQNPYTLNSSFSNGANFNYTTTTPQRDSLFSSIGFNVNFNKKYDASFNYTASSCNPTVLVQGFNASLGMHF